MKKMLFTLLLVAGCNSAKSEAVPAAAAAAVATVASEPPPIALGTKMKCPVSGEEFTVSPKTAQLVYAGKRYAFCCDDCLPEFNKNPAKFAKN